MSLSTLTRTDQPPSRLIYHKVCLAGMPAVGKSSFFVTVKTGQFPSEITTSRGLDVHHEPRKINGEFIGLSINDTMGLDRVGTLTSNFFKGAVCVMFMFSVEEISSLDNLDEIVQEAKQYINSKKCFFALVGTKIDLLAEITEDFMEEKRKQLGCDKTYLISSKSGIGLKELLDDVAVKIIEQFKNTLDGRIQLQPNLQETSRKCPCGRNN